MNKTPILRFVGLSTLAASVAFALAAAPAQAGHFGGGGPAAQAGPTFATGTTCVLNRFGAGDCIISGTVGATALSSVPATLIDGFIGDGISGVVSNYPDLATGSLPGAASVTYAPVASLTAASISGSADVSVIGFGCNNTASSPGALDPCYVDVAVTPGGVVGGVVQGELSYTYSALSNTATDSFVQTGMVHPVIENAFEGYSYESPPAAGPGQLLVDNGLQSGGAYEWTYYDIVPADEVAVGYDVQGDPVFGSVTVDPPVQDYITSDVGGTISGSPLYGPNGLQVGDAGVLGSNSPGSFGLTSGGGSGVPEPTMWGLLGFGLLAAGASRKRRGVVGI